MDWAIRAAKKKTQRLPGSSRSIVESLNIFNNVVNEGQSLINTVMNETDQWLKNEVRSMKTTSSKSIKQEDEKSSIISPEKTISHFEFDLVLSNDNEDVDTKEEIQTSETPERIRMDLPGETPKSLAEDNYTEDIKKIQYDESNHKVEHTAIGASPKRISPWSSIKVDKSVKEVITAHSLSSEGEKTEEEDKISKGNLESIEDLKPSKNSEISASFSTKSFEQLAKDRSQRRSNMFVPLPSKDPLIVQQATPAVPMNKISSIPTLKATRNAKITQPKRKNSIFEKRGSLNPRDSSFLPRKESLTTSTTQSPVYNSTLANSANVKTVTTSVFDRLSSLPTKSFENKVASRASGRKISPSSSIDVTGSPMRRISPSTRVHGTADVSIQETLKNIFSTKGGAKAPLISHSTRDSNAGKGTRRALVPRVAKSTMSAKGSPTGRKSMSSYDQPNQTGRKLSNKVIEKEVVNIGEQNRGSDKKLPPLNFKNMKAKSLTKSPIDLKLAGSPHEGIQYSCNEVTTSFHDGIQDNIMEVSKTGSAQLAFNAEKINNISPTKNTSKQHDRLTRFQLLPPVESERDDLKRKLNKRLSEVIRTQQHQNRRRQEQQKRKSHLEEDLQRRTRLWNEIKETPLNATPNPAPAHGNATIRQPEINTVLHDLNDVDHRTIIGDANYIQNQLADENSAANQTLPEINSDSEGEMDLTLASWARSPYLQEQLHMQQNWDPKKIFGPIPPLHIDQIFQNSRLNKLKTRQSSGKRT